MGIAMGAGLPPRWGGMTYFRLQALLAIPAGRLWRLNPVPAEQGFSHGSLRLLQDGGENQRIQKNKTPSANRRGWGFLFLEAWQ